MVTYSELFMFVTMLTNVISLTLAIVAFVSNNKK